MHLVLAADQHARYRAAAEREGVSLSAWLRRAADSRLERAQRRLDTVEDLDAFFAEIDAASSGAAEPDWHLLDDDDERVSSAGPSL